MSSPHRLLIAFGLVALLAGCDMLGIESPEKLAAAREADGKAIGAACRQSARALEDCFTLNRKADRAAIFAGWREMNDYMRENKIDAVTPQLTAQAGGPKGTAEDKDAAPAEKKPAKNADGTKPKARAGQES